MFLKRTENGGNMKTCLLFDRAQAEKTKFLQSDLNVLGSIRVEKYQVNYDTIEFHLEVDSKEIVWEIVHQCLEVNLPHGFGFSDDPTKRHEEAILKLKQYHR